MERGFGFEWKSGEPPKLIMPDGSERTLLVDQDVPMLASATLPAEKVTEQDISLNVAEASATPLPHPGGEDVTSCKADQRGTGKELDGGIVAGIPKDRQKEDGQEITAC